MTEGERIFDKKIPYTVVRNEILDDIMPKLSASGWKVLSAIVRATMGWQKQEDALSYSQLMERTGIGSKSTISRALKELKGAGYIENHQPANPAEPKTYALNQDYVLILRGTETVPGRSTETVPRVVQKLDTQKKALNKDTTTTPKTLTEIFTQATSQLIGKYASDRLEMLADDYPRDWVIDAIHEGAISSKGPPSVKYITAILERWKREGKHAKRGKRDRELTDQQRAFVEAAESQQRGTEADA